MMTKLRSVLVALMAALPLCGCVGHRTGYQKASAYYRSMITSYLSDPLWYQQYDKESDPEKRRQLRNHMIEYCVWLVDLQYNEYVTRFSKRQAAVDLAADFGSLAMSGASAVATPAALFGAIATGIQGAHASYSKDMLDAQSRSAIILKMGSLRANRLAIIYKSEQLPDSQYSLMHGLIDVQQYVNDGSVPAALASITQDAAIESQASARNLQGER